ncbi:unnamed protein product [Closterium sp. Naga37s-1]|nr:unnamed protein product [Closterium sp. Naga37s-1]
MSGRANRASADPPKIPESFLKALHRGEAPPSAGPAPLAESAGGSAKPGGSGGGALSKQSTPKKTSLERKRSAARASSPDTSAASAAAPPSAPLASAAGGAGEAKGSGEEAAAAAAAAAAVENTAEEVTGVGGGSNGAEEGANTKGAVNEVTDAAAAAAAAATTAAAAAGAAGVPEASGGGVEASGRSSGKEALVNIHEPFLAPARPKRKGLTCRKVLFILCGLFALAILAGLVVGILPPVIPPGAATMPSVWWTTSLRNNSKVMLFSQGANRWIAPPTATAPSPPPSRPSSSPALDWSKPWAAGLTTSLPLNQSLTIVFTSSSSASSASAPSSPSSASPAFALQAPSGLFLAPSSPTPRATFAATAGSIGDAAAFVAEPAPGDPSSLLIRLASPPASYLTVSAPPASLLALHPPGSLPARPAYFRVREGMEVAAARGVNLGGWLVAEEWMEPGLFEGVPDVVDGVLVQLQAQQSGRYVSLWDSATGEVRASATSPSSAETFFLRLAPGPSSSPPLSLSSPSSSPSNVSLYIRAANGRFLSIPSTSPASRSTSRSSASAAAPPSSVLVAKALSSPASPLWSPSSSSCPSCLFSFLPQDRRRGEWQLSQGLRATQGDEEAERRVKEHREGFVREEDLAYLSRQGVNTVRVPVGYWTVYGEGVGESGGTPFVGGGLAKVDQLFDWAEKHGVRVLFSLHGAHGSQNGYDHSGSQDGFGEFGRADSAYHVTATLNTIQLLAKRYAARPAFLGMGVLNEPTSNWVNSQALSSFYRRAYTAVRAASPCAYVGLSTYADTDSPFLKGLMTGDEHTNVLVDLHIYSVHAEKLRQMSLQQNLQFLTLNRSAEIRQYQEGNRMAMVGEWSLALPTDNDSDPLPTWIGLESLEEERCTLLPSSCSALPPFPSYFPCPHFPLFSFTSSPLIPPPFAAFPVLPPHSSSLSYQPHTHHQDDVKKFTETQREVFGQAKGGWYFWSLKLNRTNDYPNWSFRSSVAAGWLKNASSGSGVW